MDPKNNIEWRNIVNKEEKILRLSELQKRVPLSRSRIYALASDGRFPQPIKLGERASGWIEREVEEWLERKILEARGGLDND